MIKGIPWNELKEKIFNIKFDFDGFWDSLSKKEKGTLQELIDVYKEAKEK